MTKLLETEFAQAAEKALRDLVHGSEEPLGRLAAAAGELFRAFRDAVEGAQDDQAGVISDMLTVFEGALARVWAEFGGHPDNLPDIGGEAGKSEVEGPRPH